MITYIKQCMKVKGVKQQQLADALGVSLQSVKNTLWKGNYTLSTLDRIATAIGVEPWVLLVDPARVPFIYKAMNAPDIEAIISENEQLKEHIKELKELVSKFRE